MKRRDRSERQASAQAIDSRVRAFVARVQIFTAARAARLGQTGQRESQLAAELDAADAEISAASDELEHQRVELARVNAELDVEVQRYRDLFEAAPDASLVTTLHGVIREANAAAGVLLGVPPSFLVDKALLHFVARKDTRLFRQALKAIEVRPERVDLRIRLRPRGGAVVGIDLCAIPVHARSSVHLRWVARAVVPDARELAAAAAEAVRVLRADGSTPDERAAALDALEGVAVLIDAAEPPPVSALSSPRASEE